MQILLPGKVGGTPHQESEDTILEAEGTRNVQGRNMAKIKTQHTCRSQGIGGQPVGLEQPRGSSLFMSWIGLRNPGSKLEDKPATISTHDVLWTDLCDPTAHADCERNSQVAPAALGLSCTGPAVKSAGAGLVQWLPHFSGISDGNILAAVRRYSIPDRRAIYFASLDARHEHVFGVTGTDQVGDMSQNKQGPSKNTGFGGARAHKGRSQQLALGEKILPHRYLHW